MALTYNESLVVNRLMFGCKIGDDDAADIGWGKNYNVALQYIDPYYR